MWMKSVCQDTTPILGIFAGYRKKQSHNHMIESHWALSILPKNKFNATNKGEIFNQVLITVLRFSELDYWFEKKHQSR